MAQVMAQHFGEVVQYPPSLRKGIDAFGLPIEKVSAEARRKTGANDNLMNRSKSSSKKIQKAQDVCRIGAKYMKNFF
jgi:hypothetical protein